MMRIISITRLKEFWLKHNEAQASLQTWHKTVKTAKWDGFSDVRKTFNPADTYKHKNEKTYVIFNVGGNNYRIVVKIEYKLSIVFIYKVMTHTEYSKDKWKAGLI